MRRIDREALAHMRDCLRWLGDLEGPAGVAEPGPDRLVIERCVEEMVDAASTLDGSIRSRHPEVEWELIPLAGRWFRHDFRHLDYRELEVALTQLFRRLGSIIAAELGPPITAEEVRAHREDVLKILREYGARDIRVMIPGLVRGDVAFLVHFGDAKPVGWEIFEALETMERRLAWVLDCSATVTDADGRYEPWVMEAYARAAAWPL